MPIERDIRDVHRAIIAHESRDEYYRTFYPKTGKPKEWDSVSVLTPSETRKAALAYYLDSKHGITAPKEFVEHYLRLVVSKDGLGRSQGLRAQMVYSDTRKKTIWERIWPFGRDKDAEA